MKAIKDVRHRVRIRGGGHSDYGFYWMTEFSTGAGIYNNLFSQKNNTKTKESAKRNWKRFAKVNKIENWEFV